MDKIENNAIKCLYCGEEISNGSKKKYCSERCNYLWAKENPRHLKKCETCNKEFKTNSVNQRFCSRTCTSEWLKRTATNQHGDINQREIKFKEAIEKKNPNFKYHSGYESSESYFKVECKVCGHIQERTSQYSRPSRNRHMECDNCNQLKKDALKDIAETKLKEREERLLIQKKVKNEIKLLHSIANKHKFYVKCSECGRNFFTSRGNKKTCCEECRKRSARRIHDLNRRGRLIKNGDADFSITLDKLIKRDENICHICGHECDKTDYKYVNDSFITGNTYPSIDHVKPISKGGKHTWDNVKLAHFRCNSIKSDKLEYKKIKYEHIRGETNGSSIFM